MLEPRLLKLWRDARAERGRLTLMLLAIAVSLSALGAMLGAWAILEREITRSYASTRPAHATLELPAGVDEAALALTRSHPLVAEADAREVTLARIHVGRDWRPLLLFTPPSFERLTINRFTSETGAWPPPHGSIAIERSAQTMADAGQGDEVEVKAPHGAVRKVLISGIVHDAGLAPAWQERSVYGYATPETLAALEGSPTLHELRVRFRQEPAHVAAVEALAQELGQWLNARGVVVTELRVPPPRQHPHQRQMTTVLLLLVGFAALTLVLSAVLVATSLAALLARQVREIGVMKTLGARSRQLVSLYALLMLGLGASAAVAALPLGILGARVGARAVSRMLNFDLLDISVPSWVLGAQAASGVGLPLLLALFPIVSATRATVRDSLDAHGARPVSQAVAWLPRTARDLLRRPKRLALTLSLLAIAGALFTTALSVAKAWDKNLAKIQETRHYDVEIRLHTAKPVPLALQAIRGVRTAEWWGYAPAAFAQSGRIDTVRTYPDRGHGSLTLLAPPARTRLISFPLLAGRWLRDDDLSGVVLNHVAAAQNPRATVGARVLLSAEGNTLPVRVVGIVEEVGSAGVVYMNRAHFEASFGPPRLARVVTDATSATDRAEVIRHVEDVLASGNAPVEAVLPFTELRTAVGDHVIILVRALVALAFVLAAVGLLGLTSAMTTAVIERTREIGVMKAVGATSGRVLRLILAEGALTAFGSVALAFLVTLPLTALVESLIGRLGFLAPLPFVVSTTALVSWLLLVTVFGLLATWLPARRAAGIPVREAISQL
jgi:putative ABC transport system permease protein